MLIAILADTHLPRGSRRLPDACIARLGEADVIVHAGDFTHAPVLDELEAHGALVAVHGNVDEPALRRRLPEQLQFEAAPGITIGLIHDAGPRRGRLDRLRLRFPQASAVIFGHSHLPVHERAEDGFQIFNPGSPTDRRRSPHHTIGLARVTGDEISFELIELD